MAERRLRLRLGEPSISERWLLTGFICHVIFCSRQVIQKKLNAPAVSSHASRECDTNISGNGSSNESTTDSRDVTLAVYTLLAVLTEKRE